MIKIITIEIIHLKVWNFYFLSMVHQWMGPLTLRVVVTIILVWILTAIWPNYYFCGMYVHRPKCLACTIILKRNWRLIFLKKCSKDQIIGKVIFIFINPFKIKVQQIDENERSNHQRWLWTRIVDSQEAGNPKLANMI